MKTINKKHSVNGGLVRIAIVLITIIVALSMFSCKKTTENEVTTDFELNGSWTGTDTNPTTPVDVKYSFTNTDVSRDYGGLIIIGDILSYNNANNSMLVKWLAYPDSLIRYQRITWTESKLSNFSLTAYEAMRTQEEAISTTDLATPTPISMFTIGTGPAQFAKVQGGTFSNSIANITISTFYMDKYEVTQHSYKTVMGNNPATFKNVVGGPVEQVTWFDAIEYCNRRSIQEGFTPCYAYDGVANTDPASWPSGWNTDFNNHLKVTCNWTANGYRLPTEMEWMFAARSGSVSSGYTYSGSNYPEYVAWYNINSGRSTHPVASLYPNIIGLYDMSGNVFEWCWDIYGNYNPGAQTNPTGATDDTLRVTRGGGWSSGVNHCTVSNRSNNKANVKSSMIGFRVCRKTI